MSCGRTRPLPRRYRPRGSRPRATLCWLITSAGSTSGRSTSGSRLMSRRRGRPTHSSPRPAWRRSRAASPGWEAYPMAADTDTLPRPRPQPEAEAPSSAVPRVLAAVPLLAILAVQVVLSVRLLRNVGASGDESLYIYAGHQEVYTLFHGGGSPYYEDWFSGSPVIYPLLAAMADHLGGLMLVREMSMAFMLMTTVLVYATTRRLCGYWPAVTAAALFTVLGITQGLGVLATYDAMSLALIAFAAYCAVRAGDGGALWLLVVPSALLGANATAY